MISFKEAEEIHKILIDQFGGMHGIRDAESLISALSRPFQTFDKKELYPSTIDKAAALIESILGNHPFIDGNKRIGWVLMRLFLKQNGIDIKATQEERYEFVVAIASGSLQFDSIFKWLMNHTH